MSADSAANRILVAGIGNVFLGDDGFGVEVVRRIDRASLPERVDVADYGIRGLHLAYALLGGAYQTLVLVDALPLDEAPGTLTVLEVDPTRDLELDPGRHCEAEAPAPAIDAHAMNPEAVLRLLHNLGGSLDRVLVIGARPASIEERMGLSEVITAVLDEAVRLVTDVVHAEAGTHRIEAAQ